MNKILEGKSILITGGTGSLGAALVKRRTGGEYGKPRVVVIYSRDELKQAYASSGESRERESWTPKPKRTRPSTMRPSMHV